jgi:hypothetical protein
MSNEDKPHWLQDLAKIRSQYDTGRTPEAKDADKRHWNNDMLIDMGVSPEHVKRAAEIAELIGTQTNMSHTEAHEWVTNHIYALLRGGGEITEYTFTDLLKRAGIKS